MYRAGEMLRGQALPLERVARQVGYESAMTFIRAFKREFKASPG